MSGGPRDFFDSETEPATSFDASWHLHLGRIQAGTAAPRIEHLSVRYCVLYTYATKTGRDSCAGRFVPRTEPWELSRPEVT